MGSIVSHSLNEFNNGVEDSVAKFAFGEVTKETLDHVEPRGAGWREVNVEAPVACPSPIATKR